MHDVLKGGDYVPKKICLSEAKKWNDIGYGIFWTINSFYGERQIRYLKHINAWAIDLDQGTKEEMMAIIKRGPTPSLIVESKRGYHIYFKAVDAQPKHWNSIMLDRLVPFYGADKNARDMARLLRVPGFNHLKEPTDPFLIKKLWECSVSYTEAQMDYFFPVKEDLKKQKKELFELRKDFKAEGNSFFEQIWNYDCIQALLALSGQDCVNNEVFSFSRNTIGTHQILVNNKSSSCWIDNSGRIGSYQKGGPTIWQWLRWYGNKDKDIYQIIKKHLVFNDNDNV